MPNLDVGDPEHQVLLLIEMIELRTECEDCGKMSFGVMLREGCPYCVAPK